MSERWHRFVRAIFTHYPVRFGAAWLNRRLDRWFDGARENWVLAPARGRWPTMVLDLSHNLQRKLFYFPKVYGRFYGRTPFGAYLAQRLRRGATFLDIGANVGFFSLQAASLVGPTGRVYAFEPDPRLHEALVRSARANELANLAAFPIALSDRDGELPFFRAHDGTASSLVPEAPGYETRYAETTTARVTTLDRLVDRGEIDLRGAALIKVDVEGEEVRTIAGMLSAIRNASPSIWCEVRGPHGSTRAPGTYAAVAEQLASVGYRPYWWDGARHRPVQAADVRERHDVLFERG